MPLCFAGVGMAEDGLRGELQALAQPYSAQMLQILDDLIVAIEQDQESSPARPDGCDWAYLRGARGFFTNGRKRASSRSFNTPILLSINAAWLCAPMIREKVTMPLIDEKT